MTTYPSHVSIIADGNRRYAKNNGLFLGHDVGYASLKKIVEYSVNINIEYLSFYIFSVENFSRSQLEINFIYSLLRRAIKFDLEDILNKNIILRVIGDLNLFPHDIIDGINDAINKSKRNNGLNLILALGYSGQNDIIQACEKIRNKNETAVPVDKNYLKKHLMTCDIPAPDLMIRTGNEYRISNFILWDLAYTELIFHEKMWPEFEIDDFEMCLNEYNKRQRRYGK